jgi:hypothetical protein
MADGLLSGNKNHRGSIIFNHLIRKVRDNKIICPFVFQRNEYFTYFDKSKNKKCDDVLLGLSSGKQVTIVTEKIFEAQFKRMAGLYLNDPKSINSAIFSFYGSDIFDARFNENSDLEEKLGIRIVVLLSGFLLPNQKQIDQNLLTLFEKRKNQIKSDKLTKEQVLYQEKRGRLYDLIKQDDERVKQYRTEIDPTGGFFGDESLRATKRNILKYWTEVINEKGVVDNDHSILKSFINSDFFLSIPIDHISAILFTELLTNDRKIKITDHKDIESLSFIFPYSDIAIVDDEMNSYLHKTKLDDVFNVSTFSLKSTDKFLKAIEKI